MAESSTLINKSLRKHVSPVLREAGFEKVDARNGWAWKPDATLVVSIRAVGRYFGEVTGWPPSSVCVWLGANYSFMPYLRPLKLDPAGRVLPSEHECHMRSHVERRLEQEGRIKTLSNAVEKKRRDIWWFDSNGGNAEEVARDIAECFQNQAVPWFARCLDLDAAFRSIESERDCFTKYVRAAHLAKRIDRVNAHKQYSDLAEKEGKRIGVTPDPKTWFAAYA